MEPPIHSLRWRPYSNSKSNVQIPVLKWGTATSNETLKNFGDGSMHIISSALTGDIDGGIVLFITTNDFEYLSDVMKPVMSLLFMPRPGSDTSVSDNDDPDSMQDQITGYMDDARYREHMLDALGEMGNVLIGLYTQSIYKTYRLNSHHSVPLVMKDPRQKTIQRILYSMGEREKQHVVIENEFFLEDGAIKIWCLISPSEASFQDMIKAIN